MTNLESARWLLEHENDETPDDKETRRRAAILLGREPVAEDWDRIPEMVRIVLEIPHA